MTRRQSRECELQPAAADLDIELLQMAGEPVTGPVIGVLQSRWGLASACCKWQADVAVGNMEVKVSKVPSLGPPGPSVSTTTTAPHALFSIPGPVTNSRLLCSTGVPDTGFLDSTPYATAKLMGESLAQNPQINPPCVPYTR